MLPSKKMESLKDRLAGLKRAVVAYSGGVDSTFLLRVAFDVLGDQVVAITVSSPFSSDKEIRCAKALCHKQGIRHEVLDCELPARCWSNCEKRCYYCKKAVFAAIIARAKAWGISSILEASHQDDAGDYRPGRQALKELKVLSPLAELKFTKVEIREQSRRLGLPTADKEASPCAATRFPYGEKITPAGLKRVTACEDFLRSLNLRNVRVRSHNDLARLEVHPGDMPLALAKREVILRRLKKEGFAYVALDLQGYRTGAMNEVIKWKKKS